MPAAGPDRAAKNQRKARRAAEISDRLLIPLRFISHPKRQAQQPALSAPRERHLCFRNASPSAGTDHSPFRAAGLRQCANFFALKVPVGPGPCQTAAISAVFFLRVPTASIHASAEAVRISIKVESTGVLPGPLSA